jgi:2-polyprenyl-3-methyl-5-hydroxy-6-metoxy-1,4-benzoquinol methylase
VLSTVEPSPTIVRRCCRACGSEAAFDRTGITSNGYALVRCEACATVMTEREPAAAETQAIYNELFESGGYAQHRAEFDRLKAGRSVPNAYRLHMLKRLERMSSGRRLIEIGGGTGAFGVLAASRGWQYSGWDVSASAVAAATELSLNVRAFSPETVPPLAPGSADVVVAWEVIEHVVQLQLLLRAIRAALVPGGIFAGSTPNFQRPIYQKGLTRAGNSSAPIHVNFFTAASLSSVIRAAGFNQVTIVKRRLYRPDLTIGSIASSAGIAAGLLEPKTLYCLAKP